MAKPKSGGLSRELKQEAVDLVVIHGTINQASRHSGIKRTTLQHRFDCAIADGVRPQPSALKQAGLKAPSDVPFVEDEQKFREEWTPQMCIDELMRIVKANPRQVISRNFFRIYSCISESTWTRYFGTFEEFKRQAGVTQSRHVHRLEKNVAKHASLDKMRDLTHDKRQWAEDYLRPAKGRWATAIICSDVHDIEADPFWRAVFIDTVQRVAPELVILNGDIFDLPEFGKYTVDPREWDVTKRIGWVHSFLADIRFAAPDAQIDFIEGNHEFRLLRHMAEASPAMQAVLSDLHHWSVPDLLGLTPFEVNYIAPADLGTITQADVKAELRRNFKIYWDSFMCCHFPEAREYGYPGCSGHHHSFKVWDLYSPRYGSYKWYQLGAGHKREASFTNGEKWDNGFMLVHVDLRSKSSVFEYIDVRDHAVVGGKFYVRKDKPVA